jgi:hypothetical protein
MALRNWLPLPVAINRIKEERKERRNEGNEKEMEE